MLQRTGNMSVTVIVGQIRSTAVDLLRGSGMSYDEAAEAVRGAAAEARRASRQPAATIRSTTSGAKTCSITITAAPITPARSSSVERGDPQRARGERDRALVDDLAHAGEQVLVGVRRCRRR